MAKVENKIFIVMISLMSAITIALLIFFFINHGKVKSIKKPEAFNAYCFVPACESKNPPIYTNYEGKDDGKYVSLNYCTINSPKVDFMDAMRECGNSKQSSGWSFMHEITKEGKSRIEIYSKWYNDKFTLYCGDRWLINPNVANGGNTFAADVPKCLNNI